MTGDIQGSRAAVYLEALQAQAYRGQGLIPPDDPVEMGRQIDFAQHLLTTRGLDVSRAELEADYRDLLQRRATRYEDPWAFGVLEELADAAEYAAGWLTKEPVERPLFGTLPIHRFNALAIRVPGSQACIIALQHGVFDFIQKIAKAVVECLPRGLDDDSTARASYEVAEIKRHLAAHNTALERVSELMEAYVYQGDSRYTAPYLHESEVDVVFTEHLVRGAEAFLVGHEYGHIVAGHLRTPNTRAWAVSTTNVQAVALHWSDEIVADALGGLLSLRMGVPFRLAPPVMYAGIELFFQAAELIERTLKVAVHGDAEGVLASDTHPPPLLRCEAVRQRLRERVDEQTWAYMEWTSRGMATIREAAWEHFSGDILAFHRAGRLPSSVWLG